MAFPEMFLDELVRKNDIADVVGGYVHLIKKSGNNMFGLCPFHSEKTPSFSVSLDKQIYHCFGCGKGGGVINFIMEAENLSYPDAVQVLAKRSGLTVPDDKVSKETQSKRARILELNSDAARFFYSVLTTPQGDTAQKYIVKRDISKAMVTRFGIGAAPDSWNALNDAMTKKGYTRQELLDAGLVKQSKNESQNVYDAFRNRLMFPVIDVRGSIIGFSGRILGDGEPKYLNSSDTLVFDKSRNLFALNLAKKSKAGMLILTEGNIDVVALHQTGFDCAVASLGTSLTDEQARLMSRYTQTVIIAYDADDAGVKASQRAIGLLDKAGVGVRVLRMQGAKDPDEFIKKFGRDAFSVLLERSENRIDYRLQTLKSKHSLETDDGRLKYLKDAIELLATLYNATEREIFGAKVAEAAGVSPEAVNNEVVKAVKKRLATAKKKNDAKELNVKASFQPVDKSIRYTNEYSAVAEEGVIHLLILDNTLFDVIKKRGFDEAEFTSPFLMKIYRLMCRRREAGYEVAPALILAELDRAEASHFSVILQRPQTLANGEKAMADYIEKIRSVRLTRNDKETPSSDKDICDNINKLRADKLKKDTKEDPLAILQKYRDQTGCGG